MIKQSLIILILLSSSCQRQKIVKNIEDAQKLEIYQDKFIGKPLRLLLGQIQPKIKSAIGDPDNISPNTIKHIQLSFVDKGEYLARKRQRETPTSITVALEPAKVRKAPLSGAKPWTKKQVVEYGDMIVIRVWVSGKN